MNEIKRYDTSGIGLKRIGVMDCCPRSWRSKEMNSLLQMFIELKFTV